MKELREKKYIQALVKHIESKRRKIASPIRIMEVCGTHTMTIHKHGLKNMLEDAGVEMLSGPGCPVCITPNEIHEVALDIVTNRENFLLATFGDMTRVPTRKGALQTAIPAPQSQIKIVYSPAEALELARVHPKKEVIFFGVGFETTIPGIVLTVKEGSKERLENYSILSAFWLIPPPLKAIVESGDTAIDGFLYPGHVSAVIGEMPYRFLAEEHGIPGAITGFEPGDVLLAVSSILDQILNHSPKVANEYTRVVRPEGNPAALAVMQDMLDVKDAFWRGLGRIPGSGMKLKARFSRFDTEYKFGLKIPWGSGDLPGCRCGDILRGVLSPPQCPLFKKRCRPESPHGPCMVSFEGACLAYYKYETKDKAK